IDLNAMRGAFGEALLVLGPRVNQFSATVEDHQDVFVQPALLATLLEDAFEQSQRASFDVAFGRYGFHRRLLAPHEYEDTILRLGPHRRNRTPRPAIGVQRQWPVADVIVGTGHVAATLFLRHSNANRRTRRDQSQTRKYGDPYQRLRVSHVAPFHAQILGPPASARNRQVTAIIERTSGSFWARTSADAY